MTRHLPRYLAITTLLGVLAGGCSNVNHYVVASTGTVIGVDVSQDPATQSPRAKLGYNRGELALVPTNRPLCKSDANNEPKCAPATGSGAKDTTDVLMELRYGGIFDLGKSSGIYQRLAVGNTAVSQPGAAFMFAKSDEGEIKAPAGEALREAVSAQKESAATLATQLTGPDGRTTQESLQPFFRCAGFDEANSKRLAERYAGKTKDELKTEFTETFGFTVTEWEKKFAKCAKA